MPNVIIYPQGNVGNTDPHIVFDDNVNKIQFNVKDKFLSLSSATVSDGVNIGPQNVTASGVTVTQNTTGGDLFVGGVLMVNEAAVWV
jgi:hypothetical protein